MGGLALAYHGAERLASWREPYLIGLPRSGVAFGFVLLLFAI